MNYLAPLLFAGTLVLLAGSAFLWVWYRDRKAMREFAKRYRKLEDGHGNDITHLVDP